MVHASDGRSYAVKFVEKVQNGRLGQARELVAGLIGSELGSPAPRAAVLELTDEFVKAEPALTFADKTRPAAGLAIGMSYLPPMNEPPHGLSSRLALVEPTDVVGVIAFNTWLAVVDRHWGNYAFYWDTLSAVRLATLDFADSLGRDPAVDPVIPDPVELQQIAARHDTLLSDEATKIESVGDDVIDVAIAGVPSDWLDQAARDAVAALAKSGRGKMRKTLEGLRP